MQLDHESTVIGTEPAGDAEPWSVGKGIFRGAIAGILTAIILAGLLAVLAWYLPLLAINVWLRTAIGFGVAWILLGRIQHSAGMVGRACTAIAITLALLTLLSNHVVFAIHGVPTRDGQDLIGMGWLNPLVVLMANWSAMIGVAGCAWLRHDGGADGQTLIDILTMRTLGD